MRRRIHCRLSQPLFTALAYALVGAACGGGDDGSPSKLGGAQEPAPSVASAPAGLEAPLPPLGLVQAWVGEDALVSALANQAMRGAILETLAQTVGFTVSVGDDAGLEKALTLRAVGEPLEVVLARVLAGIPHALTYRKDPFSGAPRLVGVTVGLDGSSPTVIAAATPPQESRREERRRELTPEQREERAERASRMWAQSLANLESSDAEVRADGARWLDVNSTEGFQAATDRLANDESPLVRAAAAEALLDSDVGAVQPLLQALGDPDSRVVLAALEALEFVGDASTVPHIAPLLKHRDVEVRERTVQAIEFLQ